MSARDTVFTFWHETWASSLERKFMPPERLLGRLLSSARVGGLLVANPFRSAPRHLARKLWPSVDAPPPERPKAELITPLRLRRNEATDVRSLRTAYLAYDRRLQMRAQRMGLERPAVITTNPYYAAFAPLEWAGPVTYYAWDDWTALAVLSRWEGALDMAYKAMAARGTRICAVSAPLLTRIAPTGPGIVVPNGIVPEEWQPPWGEPPAWLQALPGPKLLYAGSIQERLDTNAIKGMSEAFPNASIVVVGPVSDFNVVRRLEPLPNVHIMPAVPHGEMAALVHGADVCIMPHHKNPLTESMSPLKVYEYVATGRPVVATDLLPVRGVHKRVHLVPPGGSFAGAIHDALKDGPMDEDDRQAFLARNSWQGRHEEIMDFAFS